MIGCKPEGGRPPATERLSKLPRRRSSSVGLRPFHLGKNLVRVPQSAGELAAPRRRHSARFFAAGVTGAERVVRPSRGGARRVSVVPRSVCHAAVCNHVDREGISQTVLMLDMPPRRSAPWHAWGCSGRKDVQEVGEDPMRLLRSLSMLVALAFPIVLSRAGAQDRPKTGQRRGQGQARSPHAGALGAEDASTPRTARSIDPWPMSGEGPALGPRRGKAAHTPRGASQATFRAAVQAKPDRRLS
jgi:hypothetical protein